MADISKISLWRSASSASTYNIAAALPSWMANSIKQSSSGASADSDYIGSITVGELTGSNIYIGGYGNSLVPSVIVGGNNITDAISEVKFNGNTFQSKLENNHYVVDIISDVDKVITTKTSGSTTIPVFTSGKISSGTYDFTLPSSNGTLALKSDIPTIASDFSNNNSVPTVGAIKNALAVEGSSEDCLISVDNVKGFALDGIRVNAETSDTYLTTGNLTLTSITGVETDEYNRFSGYTITTSKIHNLVVSNSNATLNNITANGSIYVKGGLNIGEATDTGEIGCIWIA